MSALPSELPARPISLRFTSDSFELETSAVRGSKSSRKVPRIPLLLDHEMQYLEVPCEYLFYIALERGRTKRSPKTWATYATHLYIWLATCALSNWDWMTVTSADIVAFRDDLLEKPKFCKPKSSPRTARTINAYLDTIARFYKWCVARGYLKKTPFDYERRHVDATQLGQLAHTMKAYEVETNLLKLGQIKVHLKAFSPEALLKVRQYLSSRDLLMADWALETGGRADEICRLRKTQIPSFAEINEHHQPIMPIKLTETKGGRSRYVYPTTHLLRRTVFYCSEERAIVLGDTSGESRIFLTKHGLPVTPKRLSTNFHLAVRRAGVSGRFHGLRHTFARRTLRLLEALKPRENIDPRLVLKVLLGHEFLKSTEIYTENITDEAVQSLMLDIATILALNASQN